MPHPQFLHTVMMTKTWIDLIPTHYNLPSEIQYSIKMPIGAIHCMKWLFSLKGATGKVNEHMSLYFNVLGPKGENQIYCFYAAP
jgi:hypothetical protein